MAEEKLAKSLAELQTQVKSKILERIAENFRANKGLADSTQYVKSDGTNYGMYTKSDDFSSLGDIWERVFPVTSTVRANTVTLPPSTTGSTKVGG